VLQCVAVCCSVLQCGAVCCSVLQCVAGYAGVASCSRLSDVACTLHARKYTPLHSIRFDSFAYTSNILFLQKPVKRDL